MFAYAVSRACGLPTNPHAAPLRVPILGPLLVCVSTHAISQQLMAKQCNTALSWSLRRVCPVAPGQSSRRFAWLPVVCVAAWRLLRALHALMHSIQEGEVGSHLSTSAAWEALWPVSAKRCRHSMQPCVERTNAHSYLFKVQGQGKKCTLMWLPRRAWPATLKHSTNRKLAHTCPKGARPTQQHAIMWPFFRCSDMS